MGRRLILTDDERIALIEETQDTLIEAVYMAVMELHRMLGEMTPHETIWALKIMRPILGDIMNFLTATMPQPPQEIHYKYEDNITGEMRDKPPWLLDDPEHKEIHALEDEVLRLRKEMMNRYLDRKYGKDDRDLLTQDEIGKLEAYDPPELPAQLPDIPE